MPARGFSGSSFGAAALCSPSDRRCSYVSAQTSPRPYRSLFGGSSSGSDPDADWLMVTMTEAYDQNVLGDVNQPLQKVFEQGGEFSELNAEMNYRAAGRRVQFHRQRAPRSAITPNRVNWSRVGHHVGVGATIQLSPRRLHSLNQTVAYSPSYLYRLFANSRLLNPGRSPSAAITP